MSESKKLINYRHLLQGVWAMWLFSFSQMSFAAISQVLAVRVWSSSVYTRITVESNRTLKYKKFTLDNPKRIIIDLQDLKLSKTLKSIEVKIRNYDPCIKSVKTRQFNLYTVRVVFKLKQNVNLQLFTLAPIVGFKERLIMDFYPTNIIDVQDPLFSMLSEHHGDDIKQQMFLKQRKIIQKDKTKRNRPIVIMLDPGHGGEDFGAIGRCCTKEKDIALQIARRLKTLIDREDNMCAYMTRNEDVFIPLQVRVAKAQEQRSDLFVSIHTNAFTSCQAIGSSVFTLSTKGATSIAAKYLANKKNRSDLISGINKSGDHYVDRAIFDMVQSLTINDSLKFGKVILNNLAKVNKLHKNNVEQANFEVLKAPDIPSVLIETAFISNIEEEHKLRTAKFQQEIAKSIFSGIKTYFSDNVMLSRRS